jgi:hypothetical protein
MWHLSTLTFLPADRTPEASNELKVHLPKDCEVTDWLQNGNNEQLIRSHLATMRLSVTGLVSARWQCFCALSTLAFSWKLVALSYKLGDSVLEAGWLCPGSLLLCPVLSVCIEPKNCRGSATWKTWERGLRGQQDPKRHSSSSPRWETWKYSDCDTGQQLLLTPCAGTHMPSRNALCPVANFLLSVFPFFS